MQVPQAANTEVPHFQGGCGLQSSTSRFKHRLTFRSCGWNAGLVINSRLQYKYSAISCQIQCVTATPHCVLGLHTVDNLQYGAPTRLVATATHSGTFNQ